MQKFFDTAVTVVLERIRMDRQRASTAVADVLKIIEDRLFDPDFKASSLNVSKPVRAFFREVFDATPSHYIRVRRIEVALFLLDNTDGKIPAIAKLVGYLKVFSFNYTFKQLMGRSPSAERRHWRSLNRGEVARAQRFMADGRPLRRPRTQDAPLDRRCLVGALEPRSVAFQLCYLRHGASGDDGLSWLHESLDAYLESYDGDPLATPAVPDLRCKSRDLPPEETLRLLERAAQPTLDVLATYETSVPKSVRSMLDHLRANVTTAKFRLDQLKDEVGAYHADRSEFSLAMGITPWQYLFEARMETASRLLRDTPLSVTVMAELLGYADPQQFRRAFKTWSGEIAPDEYRTRVRFVASRVGPAPDRFIHWSYLEHIRAGSRAGARDGPLRRAGLRFWDR